MDLPGVVLDVGSGGVTAGIAGVETPKFYVPSVGDESVSGEDWATAYPVSRGSINNWDSMTKLLKYSLKRLEVEANQRPILLTKTPLTPLEQTEKLGEIIFEQVGAPACFVADEGVLSLYAAGRLNGVVCGSGAGVSYAVAVHQGYAVPDTSARLLFGGEDIDLYLQKCLNKRNCSLDKYANHNLIAKEIKEKLGKVALYDYNKQTLKPGETNYELPDGQVIDVGRDTYQCTEVLFQPSLIGMDCSGIHEITNKAVQKCDQNIQQDMYSNVVLSGGSTMFQGFPERLKREMSSLAPDKTSIKLVASEKRNRAAWFGGTILGALGDFKPMWIKKSDYDEQGSSVFGKKLP